MTSNRPYFLRALYDWVVDNGLTPHVAVNALQAGVHVPQQYVKEGRIVLNIAPNAVQNLSMTNDWLYFDARFSGVRHQIRVPVMAVIAIYAVENGRGMVFEEQEGDEPSPPDVQPPKKSRPKLKVVK